MSEITGHGHHTGGRDHLCGGTEIPPIAAIGATSASEPGESPLHHPAPFRRNEFWIAEIGLDALQGDFGHHGKGMFHRTAATLVGLGRI